MTITYYYRYVQPMNTYQASAERKCVFSYIFTEPA